MKYIIGADVGTQSIKVQLYDQNMNLVAKTNTPQYVDTPKPMWATQKAESWWKIVRDSIQKVLKDAGVSGGDVAAFGCCAHMHGAVPVRVDGSVVEEDVQLYCDKRGSRIAEDLAEHLSGDVYRETANAPIASWHGVKIRWLKDHKPEVYEAADKFLTPKDYINFKMTGKTCIDPSEASGSFAMNCETDEWSDLLIGTLGIDREKLPEIKKAYEIIGHVSEKAAQETGLSTQTAVITGGGDMLSMLYVSGMNKLGSVVDITGTGATIQAYTKKPVMDKRIMNLRHVLDGWVPFGNIDSAGGAFRWLRDNLGKKEAEAARKEGKDDYACLCELAEQIPAGADGLYFLPYLMGERTMGSADSRGCFIGLSLEKNIGHMVRALLEGVAFEFKRTLDIFEANGEKIQMVYHSGGAAKGDTWNQIKADIYNVPICTLEADEGGVLGAALMSAVAVGFVDDLEKGADRLLKVKKTYQPNPANREIYDKSYQVFCVLLDVLQPSFKHMAKVQEEK